MPTIGNCIICSEPLTSNDKFGPVYFHKNSDEIIVYQCDECIKGSVLMCTCDKKLNENPKTISIYFPDDDDDVSGSAEENVNDKITENFYDPKYRVLFEINHDHFIGLLKDLNAEYKMLEGCRGCKFTREQIEKDYATAERSAITACVYKPFKVNATMKGLTYCGDALDEAFIAAVEKNGQSMGKPVNLALG